MKYIKLTSNGNLHIKKPGTHFTVCGRDYRPYDYLPFDEEEVDPNRSDICHKCNGKRREGPRTIKEAFTPKNFLG